MEEELALSYLKAWAKVNDCTFMKHAWDGDIRIRYYLLPPDLHQFMFSVSHARNLGFHHVNRFEISFDSYYAAAVWGFVGGGNLSIAKWMP